MIAKSLSTKIRVFFSVTVELNRSFVQIQKLEFFCENPLKVLGISAEIL